MPLPSQTLRPASRRTNMYRRKSPKRIFGFVLVAIGAVAVFFVVRNLPETPQSSHAASSLRDDSTARPFFESQPVSNGSKTLGRDESRKELTTLRTESAEPENEGASTDHTRTSKPSTPERRTDPVVDTSLSTESAAMKSSQEPFLAAHKIDPRALRAEEELDRGLSMVSRNQPVEARIVLTRALDSGALPPHLEARARQSLIDLNKILVFSPQIVPGDRFATQYTIQAGDRLETIAGKNDLDVTWQFIQRINRIPNPKRIRADQRIKLITGPFHAVVSKTTFRLDVYLGDGHERVFVTSFPVGLGEYNSTPTGRYAVRPDSKLIDPVWTNPRTGQVFGATDPLNPIGDRWIGLVGVEEHNRDMLGYGIHGTIDPDSIGQEFSMGCVRLLPDDVEIIWELLVEDASEIEIRP